MVIQTFFRIFAHNLKLGTMKKILLLIGLLILTTSSTVQVTSTSFSVIMMKTYVVNNMTYGVFYSENQSAGTSLTPFVVNITKDQLECDYYRKQLKK